MLCSRFTAEQTSNHRPPLFIQQQRYISAALGVFAATFPCFRCFDTWHAISCCPRDVNITSNELQTRALVACRGFPKRENPSPNALFALIYASRSAMTQSRHYFRRSLHSTEHECCCFVLAITRHSCGGGVRIYAKHENRAAPLIQS